MRELSNTMTASATRTNGMVAPILLARTIGSGRRWIAALLLALAPLFVHAAATCPVQIVGGNNQTLTVFDVSAPLSVQLAFMAASTAPPLETFIWRVVGGSAQFFNNESTQIIQTATYTSAGGGNYVSNDQQRLIFGGSGTVTVEAQAISCSTQSLPVVFTIIVNDPPPPPELIKLSGDGVVGQLGEIVTLSAQIPDDCTAGAGSGRRRDPNGQTGMGCLGYPVNFTELVGDSLFTATNTRQIMLQADANGTVSADLRLGPSVGTIQVEASAPGFAPTIFTLEARRAVSIGAVSGDGQIGTPGFPGAPLVVQVLDDFGTPIAGDTVTWDLSAGSGVTLSNTSTVTDAQGRTQITITFGPQPSSAVIQATTATGRTVRFTVSSQFGSLTNVSGNLQTGAINSLADQPVVFLLRGGDSNPLVDQTVNFALVEGSATLDPLVGKTDDNGRVSVNIRYGATPGLVKIQASASAGALLANATATAFVPALSASSGNNQTGVAGSPLAQPLVVAITQPPAGAGSLKSLGGVPVTWAVVSGGGAFASATTITDATGRSSNTYTLGATAGANQMRATIAGVGSVNFSATGTGATGGNTSFDIVSGNNQTITTFTDSAPLVVRARDAQGVAIAGATVNWVVPGDGTVVVNPASSVTNASGQAQTVARVQLPGARQVVANLISGTAVAASVTFALNGGVQNVDQTSDPQRSIGAAIDAACPALFAQSQQSPLTGAPADLLQRCSELVVNAGSDPNSVRQALNQMLADEGGAQGNAAFTTTAAQFDNLKARIAALRSGGGGGFNLGGLTLNAPGGAVPLSFLPSSIIADEDSASGGGEAGAEFSRWGFFATGTIGRGDRDAGQNNPGFDFETYGLTAGVDYRYNDSVVLGMALGYNNNDTSIDGSQGKLKTDGYTIAGYGTYYKGDWYADGVFTWGRNSYDVSRRIRYQITGTNGAVTQVDQTASASPDSDQTQLALSFGRDFNRGALNFGPYVRGTYTKLDFDGYVERLSNPSGPGGGLAMAVDDRSLKSLEAVLGGKMSYTISTSWGVLMPNVQLEWLHELEDDPDDLVTRFVSDPTGTDILVSGEEIDDSYFNVGLGLSGVFANGKSAFLYYEHRAGQTDFSQDSLAIGLRIEF